MPFRFSVCSIVVDSVLAAAIGGALRAHEEKKKAYPDLRGNGAASARRKGHRWPENRPLTSQYRRSMMEDCKDQWRGPWHSGTVIKCACRRMPRAMLGGAPIPEMEVVDHPGSTTFLMRHTSTIIAAFSRRARLAQTR